MWPKALSTRSNSGRRHEFAGAGLILLVVLLVLFARSFVPGLVHFSNDTPLGAVKVRAENIPGDFFGRWNDLNSIGYSIGLASPSISMLLLCVLGAVGFAKFYAPIALLLLGAGAWFFFKRLQLSGVACVCGALAVMLNSTYFSASCWGVSSQEIALASDFVALGLAVSSMRATGPFRRWAQVVLAGFAVGLNVIEGADIGAILSMFVAAYIVYHSFILGSGSPVAKAVSGVVKVGVIALFAGWIAAEVVTQLVTTQIQGVAGMSASAKSSSAHWDWATQWSLPKRETLGIVVPGLFGYRMDTPDGGQYWGAMGRNPAWDRYFASGEKGPPPPPQSIRQSGGGEYAGVLVVLVAFWTAVQAFRKKSIFSSPERKLLWFWIVVAVVSLLLAYGRFAPFYWWLYQLPYFSAIRNPAKFVIVFTFCLGTLFAYGIHALSRAYLEAPLANSAGLGARLSGWWRRAGSFDRRWFLGCLMVIGASLIGWLIYASSRQGLERYLQTVQFDEQSARAIANFSIDQVFWFILFLVLSVGLITLMQSGALAGRRATWAGVLLGALLVGDLARADLPWIVYWNYKDKYATNPIINLLREKPYEQRVAILPTWFPYLFRAPEQLLQAEGLLDQMYRIEWAQHTLLYYNVQSLNIVQMPRMPDDLAAFRAALQFRGTPDTIGLQARQWELTNTRYILGASAWLGALNEALDPAHHRFRIRERFDLVPKEGVTHPTRLEQLTAVPATNGTYALFEFTGALPRAKLYTNWQVAPPADPAALEQWVKSVRARVPATLGDALAGQSKENQANLRELASPGFSPERKVLLAKPLPATSPSESTNANPGTVEYTSYAPKDIKLSVQARAPAVLLLNDKFDPNWQVRVDGKRAELLRCNFIMRGVYLPAGSHKVEFLFKPDVKMLYVSLSAFVLGIALLAFLGIPGKSEIEPASPVKGQRSRPQGAKPAAGVRSP